MYATHAFDLADPAQVVKTASSRKRRLRSSANKKKLWNAAMFSNGFFLQPWNLQPSPLNMNVLEQPLFWQPDAEIPCDSERVVRDRALDVSSMFHEELSTSDETLSRSFHIDVQHIVSNLAGLSLQLAEKLYHDDAPCIREEMDSSDVQAMHEEEAQLQLRSFPESDEESVLDHSSIHHVDQQVRLCELRLKKVQDAWQSLALEVEEEKVMLEQCSSDGDECHSPLVDDCISLCEDLQRLQQSRHACGVWASGLAVVDRFEGSITAREGLAATLDFLTTLDIKPNHDKENILSLALKMLINNRIDTQSDHGGL